MDAESYVNKLEGQYSHGNMMSMPSSECATSEIIAQKFVRNVLIEISRWLEISVRVKVVAEDDETNYFQGMEGRDNRNTDREHRHSLSQWISKCGLSREEMCDALTRVEYAVRCAAHGFGTDENPLEPESSSGDEYWESKGGWARGGEEKDKKWVVERVRIAFAFGSRGQGLSMPA